MENLKEYLDTIYPVYPQTWNILKAIFRDKKIKKGAFLIQEGKYTKELVFVKSGIIRAFYTDQAGTEYNKRFFIHPSIAGSYSSLITGGPSLFSQQALTDCELLTADYDELTGLYDQHPELERLARKFAENYFVSNEKKEIEIVLQNADKRYLNFRKQHPDLENQIAQLHIASYLGVSPTQLSRIRKKIMQP